MMEAWSITDCISLAALIVSIIGIVVSVWLAKRVSRVEADNQRRYDAYSAVIAFADDCTPTAHQMDGKFDTRPLASAFTSRLSPFKTSPLLSDTLRERLTRLFWEVVAGYDISTVYIADDVHKMLIGIQNAAHFERDNPRRKSREPLVPISKRAQELRQESDLKHGVISPR